MTIKTFGNAPIFGWPEVLPKLPPGFHSQASREDWLYAMDEDGIRWFVGNGLLTVEGIATDTEVQAAELAGNRMKKGERFFDVRRQIHFNPETGEVIWPEEKGAADV